MTREEAIQVLKMVEAHGLADEAKHMAIEALSSEVVRCKDCRFWKNEHLCLVMSRYGRIDTKAEHYCSWGERNEE